MSKKNRFKKHSKNFAENNTNKAQKNKEQESPKEKEMLKNEYNMKADFLNLAVIIALIIGAMVGLYYYDKQNGILEKIAQWLTNLV